MPNGTGTVQDSTTRAISCWIEAEAITRRHDDLLQNIERLFHSSLAPKNEVVHWIDINHRCNTQLWAQEDLARRRLVPDAEIVANKRAIDQYNQQRNDAIEKLDELLLAALGWLRPADQTGTLQVGFPQGARLNSETMGSMIDRLSILALKIKAVGQLARSGNCPVDIRHTHCLKLQKLKEQRIDLSLCLDALWFDALAGRAFFKVYRQYKLYNDPDTNPVLMAEQIKERL